MKYLTEAIGELIITKVPGNYKATLGGVTVYSKTPINCLWDMEKKLEALRTANRSNVDQRANGKARGR